MQRTSATIAGIILIVAGLVFLIIPFFPEAAEFLEIERRWPLIIIASGGLFLIGALVGTPSLSVPGMVIIGIGSLLYYQSLNDAWESWAYTWTLIPGFGGFGTILMHILMGDLRRGVAKGGPSILTSAILFLIFASLFGGQIRFDLVWPALLIVAGIWFLIRNVLPGRFN